MRQLKKNWKTTDSILGCSFWVEPIFIYTKKDLPKDNKFEGLKIWLWPGDAVFKDWIAKQKAKEVPAQPPEVLTKLEKNEIEVVYGIDSAVKRMNWQKLAKFKSEKPVSYAYGFLLVRKKVFNVFNKEQKKLTVIR